MTISPVILTKGAPKALLPLCEALTKAGIQPSLLPVKGG